MAQKGKILIIDTDPLLSELVHFHFNAEYEVERISAFDQVLEINAEDYSLVLLDPEVDGGSGREIIDILSGGGKVAIPIIVFGRAGDNETVVNCLNAGASDFIARPFSVSLLVQRLKKALGK